MHPSLSFSFSFSFSRSPLSRTHLAQTYTQGADWPTRQEHALALHAALEANTAPVRARALEIATSAALTAIASDGTGGKSAGLKMESFPFPTVRFDFEYIHVAMRDAASEAKDFRGVLTVELKRAMGLRRPRMYRVGRMPRPMAKLRCCDQEYCSPAVAAQTLNPEWYDSFVFYNVRASDVEGLAVELFDGNDKGKSLGGVVVSLSELSEQGMVDSEWALEKVTSHENDGQEKNTLLKSIKQLKKQVAEQVDTIKKMTKQVADHMVDVTNLPQLSSSIHNVKDRRKMGSVHLRVQWTHMS